MTNRRNWTWWHMPKISVVGRLRQEDSKFGSKVLYTVRSCLTKYPNQYFYFYFISTITEQEVVVGQILGGKYLIIDAHSHHSRGRHWTTASLRPVGLHRKEILSLDQMTHIWMHQKRMVF